MGLEILIYEDDLWTGLLPLTYSRPACELLHGAFRLRERIAARFGSRSPVILCRRYLSEALAEETGLVVNRLPETAGGERLLFVNGRLLNPEELPDEAAEPGLAVFSGEDVAAFCLEADDPETKRLVGPGEAISAVEIGSRLSSRERKDLKLVRHPWEMVLSNGEALENDFARYGTGRRGRGAIDSAAKVISPGNVFLGEGAQVEPYAVLDGSGGPVILERGARVASFSLLRGPVFVGASSLVAGGRVGDGTSIGPVSRVSGEVQNCIILGYSNKYHSGFLGHSYLGKWVNLGAGTTNSDLKNNYGPVSVDLGEGAVRTGETKVGCFIADHCKTGIGTLLNTGTVLAFAANVFGGGMVPGKFIPSFSWVGGGVSETYRLDKCLETMEVVLSRREVRMGPGYREMVRRLFELTGPEREHFGIDSGGGI